MDLNTRQQSELEFWNTSEELARQREAWNSHLFEPWRRSQPILQQAVDFLMPLEGKHLLLCSVGPEAIPLARAGARISGFDISQAQIEGVMALAERSGVADMLTLDVMPFEHMTYPEHTFDVAYGASVLHHVGMADAARELNRVLKPGGRCSFTEPLGTNPILEFGRRQIPYRNKDRIDHESPLRYQEIAEFGSHFATCEHREFTLTSVLRNRVIDNKAVIDRLFAIDRVLLRTLPVLKPMCSQIWIGVTTAR